MSLFSELLKNHLKNKEMTVYRLSQLSGIDRTAIQKFLTGDRKPSDDGAVLALSHALSLTARETQEFQRAFGILKMGEAVWARRHGVMELISSLDMAQRGAQRVNLSYGDRPLLPQTELGVVEGRLNISGLVRALLEQESSREGATIRLIVQPDFSSLMDSLAVIDFNTHDTLVEQIITFRRAYANSDRHNLECLKRVIPALLSCKRYTPYCCFEDAPANSGFLPNLLMTSTHAIQISAELDQAILSSSDSYRALLENFYEKRKQASIALFTKIHCIDDYMEKMLMSEQSHLSAAYSLLSQPCIGPFLTSDLIKGHINEDLFSPKTVEQLVCHFEGLHCQTAAIHSVFSAEGLRQMLERGRIDELPDAYYSPFTRPEVMRLLERICCHARRGEFSLRIARPTSLSIPQYLTIDGYSHQKVCMILKQPSLGFLALDINEPSLSSAFYDFLEFLQDSPYVYSQEESVRFIQDVIADETSKCHSS